MTHGLYPAWYLFQQRDIKNTTGTIATLAMVARENIETGKLGLGYFNLQDVVN